MFKAFTAVLAGTLVFSTASASPQSSDRLSGAELKWRAMVPDVVYFAPVHGDWEQGSHAKYVRVQPGTTVPMHTHGEAYHAVLVSGRLTNLLDSGETRVDLVPGDYWYMAGKRAHGHVCTSQEPCLIYTHSDGSWDLTLVQ